MKVFKSLPQWFAEFRLYRRDEKGKVERDHLMDATRYLEMELLNICRTEQPRKPEGVREFPFHRGPRFRGDWMS